MERKAEIKGMLKFVSNRFGYELSQEERAQLIASGGFDGVLLWMGDGASLAHESRVRIYQDFGLHVENIHAPVTGMNEFWASGEQGEGTLFTLFSCLDICQRYQVDTMVMHLSRGTEPIEISKAGWERLDRLIAYAGEGGVRLAFENVRQKAMLCQALELYKDCETVGLCFDCGHDLCWNQGVNWLEDYKSRLYAVHLSDNNGSKDMHAMPFDGISDWEYIVNAIVRSAYAGKIGLEVKYDGSELYTDWMAERFLKEAYGIAGRLENMMEKALREKI